MKCNNCGKDITNDSKFCEYCGVKIEYSEKLAKNNSHKAELEQKQEKSLDRRIYKWKEKLIDLSKRNRLLSFKFPKFSTIRIIDEQPPEVYRALVQNLQTMEFLPVKVNDSEIPEEEKKSLEELKEGIEFKR